MILFGSQARDDAGTESDIDILVVEDSPADRHSEMVRLNRVLRSIEPPIDLLVVSEEKFQSVRVLAAFLLTTEVTE